MLGRSCRRWSTYVPSHQDIRRFIHTAVAASCQSADRRYPQIHRVSNPSFRPISNGSTSGASQLSAPACSIENAESTVVMKGRCTAGNMSGQRHAECSVTKEPPPELLALISDSFAPGVSSNQFRLETIQAIRQDTHWAACFANANLVCIWAEKLAQSDTPILAHHLLSITHTLGARVKANMFERVVYGLAQRCHWDLVLITISMAKRVLGKLTVRLLNWRVAALAKTGRYIQLDSVLGEFAAEGLDPTHRTFRILVQGYLRNHDIVKARATLDSMQQCGLVVDESMDAAVVSAYRGLGPDKLVQDSAYDVLQRANLPAATIALNGLVRLFLDRNDLDGALRVIEHSRRRTRRGGGKYAFRHTELSDTDTKRVSRNAIRADVATYTMLIEYAAKQHDSRRLFDFINKIKISQTVPDAKLAAALIRALYSVGLEGMALSVAHEICTPIGLETSAFAEICTRPFKKYRCFSHYQGAVTVDVFNAVLQGALQRRGIRVVSGVLRLMRMAHVRPNSSTLEIFASYLFKETSVRRRDAAHAIRILLRHNVDPTLHLSQALVSASIRRQKYSMHFHGWHALKAYVSKRGGTHPKKWKHRFSKPMYPSEGFCGVRLPRSGSFDSLRHYIFDTLQDRGTNPDRAVFATRMQQDAIIAPNPTSAKLILQAMTERGMHPTNHHFSSLLQAYTFTGDMRGAIATLHEAADYNVTPNVVHYTIIIHGYARAGRPDLALRTFRKMLHTGVEPDAAAVDAVTGAFFAVGAFALARRVLLDLWPMVAPFPEHLRRASLETLAKTLRAMQNYKGVAGLLMINAAAASVAASTIQAQSEARRRRDRKVRMRVGAVVRAWRWTLKYSQLRSKLARTLWKKDMQRRSGGGSSEV